MSSRRRLLIVTEFLGASGSPTGTLASEVVKAVEQRSDIKVFTLCSPFAYRPGGLKPSRLFNLVALFALTPLFLFWHRLVMLLRGGKVAVLVSTAPPGIQWAAQFASKLLAVPVIYWFQDAHPETEALIAERKGFPRLARLLRAFEKATMGLCRSVIVLDESMRESLVARTHCTIPVSVIPPWATYMEPALAFRPPREDALCRVLYAGHYAWHHNLKKMVDCLKLLSDPEQQKISFTFIGMNASTQDQLRALFEELHCPTLFLRRLEHVSDVLKLMTEYDFGLVSLIDEQGGLSCPSKAFTYLSQGLPILYVGPTRTLSWQLCQEGWGSTFDQWLKLGRTDTVRALQKRAGTMFPNPKGKCLQGICEIVESALEMGPATEPFSVKF